MENGKKVGKGTEIKTSNAQMCDVYCNGISKNFLGLPWSGPYWWARAPRYIGGRIVGHISDHIGGSHRWPIGGSIVGHISDHIGGSHRWHIGGSIVGHILFSDHIGGRIVVTTLITPWSHRWSHRSSSQRRSHRGITSVATSVVTSVVTSVASWSTHWSH